MYTYTYSVYMSNQRDVAKRAGLSSASVSRYLNSPDSVSAKTAEKIQRAIEELGYRIDYSAQTLKTGVFHRIGIIAASYGPFYWDILSAMEELLAQDGYYVNIYFTRKSPTKSEYRIFNMNMIHNKQVDGFILFPLLSETDDAIIRALQNLNDKFIVVDRSYDDESIYQVYLDNYQAGRTAAQALLERGHLRFIFIWGLQDMASSRDRYRGFRDELSASGISLEPERELPGLFNAEHTFTYLQEHIDALPEFDAVFASNDYSAIGFMKAFRERGLEPPRDYSIIGFDDTQVAPYLSTPLSSFSQPLAKMGHVAAGMLLDRIQGYESETRKVVLKPELVLRDSVRPL